MAVVEKTTVELDQLYLDEQNPRFDPVDSQEAAIALLCDNEDVYALAADIVKVGLSQIERLAVLATLDDDGELDDHYTVLEGNRRTCALMLLHDPDRAPGKWKKRFKALSEIWTPINDADVTIYDNREDVDVWLDRIHLGENKGVGRKGWNATQQARRKNNRRYRIALTLLDDAEDQGLITPENRKNIITTVQRYAGNDRFAQAMGFNKSDIDNIQIRVPRADYNKRMKVFLHDVLSREATSRDNVPQIEDYAEKIEQRVKVSGKSSAPVVIKPRKSGSKSPKTPSGPTGQRNRVPQRKAIIEALEILNNEKLISLYKSICAVSLTKHTPMVTVAVWSFLEALTNAAGYDNDFTGFFTKERLGGMGFSKEQTKTLGNILRQLSQDGNGTKHHGLYANFNDKQLINNMMTLEVVIVKTIEEAILQHPEENDD